MWFLAKGYGWTPETIDELDFDTMVFYINGLNWIHNNG